MKLGDMLRRQREAEEAAIAKAEREAVESGKELFDLARLEQLLGEEPGALAEREHSLRRSYYLLQGPTRTLAEYAELLNHWSMWE